MEWKCLRSYIGQVYYGGPYIPGEKYVLDLKYTGVSLKVLVRGRKQAEGERGSR